MIQISTMMIKLCCVCVWWRDLTRCLCQVILTTCSCVWNSQTVETLVILEQIVVGRHFQRYVIIDDELNIRELTKLLLWICITEEEEKVFIFWALLGNGLYIYIVLWLKWIVNYQCLLKRLSLPHTPGIEVLGQPIWVYVSWMKMLWPRK